MPPYIHLLIQLLPKCHPFILHPLHHHPAPLPPRRRFRTWGRDTITSSFNLNETLTNETYKLTTIMNPC
ncbi:hypothetical protein Hdeb2414_s0076g00776461 [Helianthus debilis subsp. tardiflorus]